jgi:hypothetical protein
LIEYVFEFFLLTWVLFGPVGFEKNIPHVQIIYDIFIYLTAIGLTPGGNSKYVSNDDYVVSVGLK